MRLLVAEDDQHILQSLKKGLELSGHVVDGVEDGEQALSLAFANQYDVIILDWMMPITDGQAVCKELRAHDNHTPILMLTAKSQVEHRVEGLNSGADDYLPKPFAFDELLARIRALGRRTGKVRAERLVAGSLSLKTLEMSVERAGKTIALSKKEFDLLEFLLRHQGRVFTKDELLTRVWSDESDVLPNTVQVYIGYLRNKIDRPFPQEPELIKTVRGFGYKLEA